jgi:hypothetical protein
MRDIPVGMLHNERRIMVWQATKDNQPFVSPKLKQELSKLSYPRFYLDFEIINLAIPRWKGTRPLVVNTCYHTAKIFCQGFPSNKFCHIMQFEVSIFKL